MGRNAIADREAVLAALEDADALEDKLSSLSLDALSPRELLAVLARRETLARRRAAFDTVTQALVAAASPGELGATTMAKVLAYKLRIGTGEAHRRIEEAATLGPRTTLTGEPLAPLWPNVARGQAAGQIGPENLKILRSFFAHLPSHVDYQQREGAERTLARHAADFGPEQFRKLAERLALMLDPDGSYNDADRARRRGVTMGRQGPDGLTRFSGLLTPEASAVWEAVLAKLAAPGMCNAEDDTPCVDGGPTEEQVQRDKRSTAQRTHDALLAAGRAVLACGKLGQLNGLPVTVIVTTTLQELESAAGYAVSAGGTMVPMPDLIRLGSHAYHYLAVFDGATNIPLYLGRSRRTASPGQRIVLYALHRGCTAPGCTVDAYKCQVHHADKDWADGGRTDVDKLTLACGPDNRKVKPGGWKTRIRADGRTEWIPPPHLDDGAPRINDYHHPENLMTPKDDDDG